MLHIVIRGHSFDLAEAPKTAEDEISFVLALTSATLPAYLQISSSLIPRRLSKRSRVKIQCPELGNKEVVFIEQGQVVGVDDGFQVKLKGIFC